MKCALRLSGLRKRYRKTVALDGLDLEVPRGVICGLIGPNGSGKTTTFGIVAGLIREDGGKIDIFETGRPFDPREQSGRLSVLPQDCQLNADLAVVQILYQFARLQGLDSAAAEREAESKLEQVALRDVARARIKELSHGMRRRVAVAQALLGTPELVLLDEPTSGLDPELALQIRSVFAAQRGNRTLVISSHNLLELETICDHVVFIEHGQCVRSGSLAEVTQQGLRMRYGLERSIDPASIAAQLPELSLRWDAGESCLVAKAPAGWTAARINATVIPPLLQRGAALLEVRQGRSLEEAYIEHKRSGTRPDKLTE